VEVLVGKLILIGSQKSDIGKTIICIKAGVELSQSRSSNKVLLVDLSSGKKKMSEYLNVNEDIIYDIKDVFDGICSFNQAVIEINDNLSLLPYPRIAKKLSDIQIYEFSRLFNDAKKEYDIIIVDIDKLSHSYIDFNIVNIVISINSNDFSCIKEINSDKAIASKNNVESIYTVLNKYNKKKAKNGTMMNSKDIQKLTEMNMNTIIEDNIKFANVGKEFLISDEEHSFNKAIKTLVNQL
jgi:septum formation inhibitor-activating ATPase MinD